MSIRLALDVPKKKEVLAMGPKLCARQNVDPFICVNVCGGNDIAALREVSFEMGGIDLDVLEIARFASGTNKVRM